MTAILAISALVGLVWGAIALQRGSLLIGCLLFLMTAACFGYYFAHFNAGPIPLTLDRLALVPLLAALIIQQRLGRAAPKPPRAVDFIILALLTYLTISTFTHDFRTSYPGVVPPIWRLVAGYGIPFAIYWVARQAPLTRQGITTVQLSLAAFGVYLAATGLLEVAGQWSLVFPRHIADPSLGQHFGRARGPMVTSIGFGLYLAVGMLAAWVQGQSWNRFARLLLLSLFPLYLAGLYYSYTRSVWIGAGAALVLVLGLTLRGMSRNLIVASLVAGALFISVTRLDSILSFQRESSASDTRDSASLRSVFAYVSWKMFEERPLTGFGFGQFYQEKMAFLADRSTSLRLDSIRALVHHNTFLSLLTETGIIGLAMFLAILFAWSRNAWRLARSERVPDWARMQAVLLLGALVVYGFQLLFHELSYSPIENSLVFFLAGISEGLRPLAEPQAAFTPAIWHDPSYGELSGRFPGEPMTVPFEG
jgi:O-antigen ligase